MKEVQLDMWQPPRQWRIVTADTDLAHVFPPPSTFSFVPALTGDGFNIKHQTPTPDCFGKTVLVRAGHTEPTFQQMTGETELPEWADDDDVTKGKYTHAQNSMRSHFMLDPDVQRLQGFIRVPCHAHGAKLDTDFVQGHAPMWIRTLIHVYQFPSVVNGDAPLLVIWAPLSPVCPLNGNGTVIGLS